MLKITIPSIEYYDEESGEFVTSKAQSLQLEHSLVSLAKWESKWNKPFLTKDTKSVEETIDYIRCMTITQNINPGIYKFISMDNIEQVNAYITKEMTATKFHKDDSKKGIKDTITAEIIYYWMVALQIPFECQKWHLNRLLTLINVCNIKNAPPKKTSRRETIARNKQLNAARRTSLNTKG